MQALRCGVRQLAVETAAARVGGVFGQRVVVLASEALRIESECPGYGTARPVLPAPRPARAKERDARAGIEVHIARAGSDATGDGTAVKPFASPVRAT